MNSTTKGVSADRLEALLEEAFEGFNYKSRRSPTMIKLEWLAARLRKAERIRREIEENTYSVDSMLVARAMLNLDNER